MGPSLHSSLFSLAPPLFYVVKAFVTDRFIIKITLGEFHRFRQHFCGIGSDRIRTQTLTKPPTDSKLSQSTDRTDRIGSELPFPNSTSPNSLNSKPKLSLSL